MTHDRVFTDQFKLTHDFLALMLGVSRPQVSVIAKQIEQAGLIAYRRGQVTVIDRRGLEARACECYGIISRYFDQFLNRLTAR
jgi:Mn-dependent DtxR family transcriptional regulator